MKYFETEEYEIKKCKDLILLKIPWNYDEEIFPSQFFMIGSDFSNALLNRPFSVSDYNDKILTFRIKKVGRFTNFLFNLEKKSPLRFIGPLGKKIDLILFNKSKVILIGGGIGIAPLIFFKRFLKESILIYGCKSKEDLHYFTYENDFNGIIYTEDGSFGEKGFPTDYLNKLKENAIVISCGPLNMYKTLRNFLDRFEIFILMEQLMGCGFGVCLGCVINTNEGYKKVCEDGPMFNLKEIQIVDSGSYEQYRF